VLFRGNHYLVETLTLYFFSRFNCLFSFKVFCGFFLSFCFFVSLPLLMTCLLRYSVDVGLIKKEIAQFCRTLTSSSVVGSVSYYMADTRWSDFAPTKWQFAIAPCTHSALHGASGPWAARRAPVRLWFSSALAHTCSPRPSWACCYRSWWPSRRFRQIDFAAMTRPSGILQASPRRRAAA
jgi:hypothetical protein